MYFGQGWALIPVRRDQATAGLAMDCPSKMTVAWPPEARSFRAGEFTSLAVHPRVCGEHTHTL
jgi:hypothetical protein